MDWVTDLNNAITFMEEHLLENISAQDISKHIFISNLYFQKGFRIMTGFSVAEYIRSRRLYLAANEVISTNEKIIDIALKYCYDTPESFTKAFTRFHGVSPTQMRKNKSPVKIFLPLKIKIIITGGNKMDYTIEKMDAFKVIGIVREFSFETSYSEIPKFWDEVYCENIRQLFSEREPENEYEKAIKDNLIGEFGVCIGSSENKKGFKYMIAGKYEGGTIPDEMELFELPQAEWAKFKCIGPMPDALQVVNTKIFNEWLPGNPEFEICENINIEWYSNGVMSDNDYVSGVWIPVKRKK